MLGRNMPPTINRNAIIIGKKPIKKATQQIKETGRCRKERRGRKGRRERMMLQD